MRWSQTLPRSRYSVGTSCDNGQLPRQPAGDNFEDHMSGPRTTVFLAICAAVAAVPASADSLPASVRACIGEADPARRLTCYDREVARAIAPPDTFSAAETVAPTVATPPSAPVVAASTPAPPRHVTAKV